MERDDALKLVGEVGAPLRLALGEGLMLAAIGRRQMVDAGEKRSEEFPVIDDAADRNAAEADAVIAALTADQAGAVALAADIVVSERDLQCGVDRLRTRITEEHAVEIGRRQRGDPARQLEGLWMGEMKRGRVVEFGGLPLDRRDNRITVVAGIRAPQPRQSIEHGAPVRREVVHSLRRRDQTRCALESSVRRERQPKRVEIVGLARCQASNITHDRLTVLGRQHPKATLFQHTVPTAVQN